MGFAILFPGQGSQHLGMGADLFAARPDLLVEAADEILGFSLRDACLDGPEERLTRTEVAQPAIFAVSYVLWEELAGSGLRLPQGAAGHSLGEYTALAAAGCLDFAGGLRLVALRGRAMARAADGEPSGMAALIGVDREQAEEICRAHREQGGSLEVANVNAPGQVVVAGSTGDIRWLTGSARDLGIRRVVPLNVAGGFHSRFMAPAREELAAALAGVGFEEPRFPVWSNTTARPHQPGRIAELLSRQVVEPVLFAETLAGMAADGIDTFVHIGPGEVTAGLARRSVPEARVATVSGLADIPAALDSLGTMVDPR